VTRHGKESQEIGFLSFFYHELVPGIYKRAKVHASSYKSALGRRYVIVGEAMGTLVRANPGPKIYGLQLK
jgi:hypothetical protein